jgi:hypothetical protein
VWLTADVLSAPGLLYSIGLGTGESLHFAVATRITTWFVLLELCASAGVIANYRDGRWRQSWAWNWLLGHVRCAGWLFRGVRGGLRQTATLGHALPLLIARRTRVTIATTSPLIDRDEYIVVTDRTA